MCIELIENKTGDIDSSVQVPAIDCLINLYKKEDKDRTSRMLAFVENTVKENKILENFLAEEYIKEKAEKEDRYYLTRRLILGYIKNAIHDPISQQNIAKLQQEIIQNKKTNERDKDELKALSYKKRELEKDKKKNLFLLVIMKLLKRIKRR